MRRQSTERGVGFGDLKSGKELLLKVRDGETESSDGVGLSDTTEK